MAKYCGESSSSSMVMGAGVWGVVGCMVADGWLVDWIGSSCDAKGEKMRINEQGSQTQKNTQGNQRMAHVSSQLVSPSRLLLTQSRLHQAPNKHKH